MGLREINFEDVKWIRYYQNRVQWRTFLNTVMYILVHSK